ncbi:MAG: RNA-binding protein [Candidatus Methanomethylicota archaeon]|nr:MAG: RNA-binding protein [Candidatus Verstraetearchaeota archaeon]
MLELRVKHRYPLRGRESREVLRTLSELYPKLYSALAINSRKAHVERMITDRGQEVYSVNGRPVLIKLDEDALVPAITAMHVCSDDVPKVVVDRGAIPHIANGADVMAPGVVQVEGEFEVGDIVAIADEKYRKIIAIGVALTSSGELRCMKKGKVVKNLHYVGDKLWKLIQKVYG